MRKLYYYLFFFMLLNTGLLYGQTRSYNRIQIKVSPDIVRQWQQADLLPSHFHYRNDTLEMELDSMELNIFRQLGIAFTDISDSFYKHSGETLQQRIEEIQSVPANFTYGSMGGYYTCTEAMAILDDMRAKFPSLVSAKDTLGWTYEGRPIVAVRISDNADVQENEEDEWLMTGLHHGNEVMGEQIVIYFAWYLLEDYDSDKEIRTLLNNSALYIVPVVNPDGLAFNESTNPAGGGTWRKNRKPRVIGATTHYGVDLNRNYGMKWGYTHAGQLGQAGSNFAGNSYYRGTAAWSEAESKAIRDLCNKHRFTAAFNYHAWDDSFNYPWNFDVDSLTDDSLRFKAIVDYCTENNHFESGTFDKTLQYTANGTSDDWLYGEQTDKNKIFAFTIEVGKSFWPAQSLIATYCDSLLQTNIKMLRMAAKYAAIKETSSDTVRTFSHHLIYDIKRYSIKDTVFTVSVTPVDPLLVTYTGPAELYGNLSFLETLTDTIPYTLSTSVTNGTVIRFIVKVDNGAWATIDTISKTFWGHSVLALDCTDDSEPNNFIGQAKQLLPGQKIKASIDDERDEDWFYVENTTAEKNIRVILSDLLADYDVELLDASGNKIASASRAGKLNDTLVYNAGYAGIFRIRVFGYKKAYRPFDCYSLVAELGSGTFKTVHAAGGQKSSGEIPFYVYPLPANDYVSVSINAGLSQNITWVIADNAGRILKSGKRRINKGTTVFPLTMDNLPNGIYLLQVLMEVPGMTLSSKIIKE